MISTPRVFERFQKPIGPRKIVILGFVGVRVKVGEHVVNILDVIEIPGDVMKPYVLDAQFLEIGAQVDPPPLRQRSTLEVIEMPDRSDAPGEIHFQLSRSGLGHARACA